MVSTISAPSKTTSKATTPGATTNQGPATASAPPKISIEQTVCHLESDFPGYGADHPSIVASQNAGFCRVNQTETDMNPVSIPITGGNPHDGVKYEFQVEWVKGCKAVPHKQSVNHPTGESEISRDCYSLFSSAFACKNGGVGGSVQVGWLKYTFTGGELVPDEVPDGRSGSTSNSKPASLDPNRQQRRTLDSLSNGLALTNWCRSKDWLMDVGDAVNGVVALLNGLGDWGMILTTL